MTCGANEGDSTEWRSAPTPAIEVPRATPLAACAGSSSGSGLVISAIGESVSNAGT